VTQSGDSAAVDPSNARPCRVISLRLRDGTPLRLILRPQPELSWTRPHSSRWLLYAIFFPICLVLLAYTTDRRSSNVDRSRYVTLRPHSTRCRHAYAATSRNARRCWLRSRTICRRR
jgi:hypothetical protein